MILYTGLSLYPYPKNKPRQKNHYLCPPNRTTQTQPMSTTQPMVDLQGQYQRLKPEIDAAIQEVLDSSHFIGGPQVARFADQLATYLNAGHVIPCANGTDALQLALMALDLQPGDEVITTPFTFIATAEVIALLGLTPVFVDCRPDSFNIDPDAIAEAITRRTRCIIPVHLFGQAANMEAILHLTENTDIYVVEDNAQAIGADYAFTNGVTQKVGTIGQIGTTSFYPSKNLGCYGDGGALFTNDDQLADRIRLLANHGMKTRYYHDEVGINSRLDAIQAAILSVKLRHLDDFAKARQQAAARYDEVLSTLPGVTIPHRVPYSNHVFHQYTVKLDYSRQEIQQALSAAGISSAIYYPVPLHLQKAYSRYGYQEGDFPVAEMLAEKLLSLPIHTELTEAAQSRILQVFERHLATT